MIRKTQAPFVLPLNVGPQRVSDSAANPWKRHTRKTIYDNPWITVYEDQVTRPDGSPGIYGVVHYKNLAVGIVAMDRQGRVLLVGQYRYPLDRYSWEIPEGGGATDEPPVEAAKRELLEETGYRAGHWTEILRAHLSNSVSDEEAVCFLATELEAGTARPDGTEQLAVRWVPFAEALEMVRRGEITDALAVMGLERAAQTVDRDP
jgi:8-oxo-dGTP pyrophosphatase MutT (NUDIX family)